MTTLPKLDIENTTDNASPIKSKGGLAYECAIAEASSPMPKSLTGSAPTTPRTLETITNKLEEANQRRESLLERESERARKEVEKAKEVLVKVKNIEQEYTKETREKIDQDLAEKASNREEWIAKITKGVKEHLAYASNVRDSIQAATEKLSKDAEDKHDKADANRKKRFESISSKLGEHVAHVDEVKKQYESAYTNEERAKRLKEMEEAIATSKSHINSLLKDENIK